MTTVFVKIMCSHSIKSVLIYSLVIYEYFLKEKINLLGKKSISDIVSDETVEVLGVAPAMFEKEVGRGRGLNRKSHLIQSSRKKTSQFFRNLQISLKSGTKTETKIQAETETRKHAQDPLMQMSPLWCFSIFMIYGRASCPCFLVSVSACVFAAFFAWGFQRNVQITKNQHVFYCWNGIR